MTDFDIGEHPLLKETVDRLVESGGDRLASVVLYGEAARGERYENLEYDLLVVLADLEPASLRRVAEPVRRWLRKGQRWPRIFSPALIEQATDVFPMEFLDICSHRVVLHGEDPLTSLDVRTDHLRLQCEREIREKMMRLREAYLEAQGSDRKLRRLCAESYPAFAAIFRGALRLEKDEVPARNADVVAAFCEQAVLDAKPFQEIERLKAGEGTGQPAEELFANYYAQLTRAVSAIDGFSPEAR